MIEAHGVALSLFDRWVSCLMVHVRKQHRRCVCWKARFCACNLQYFITIRHSSGDTPMLRWWTRPILLRALRVAYKNTDASTVLQWPHISHSAPWIPIVFTVQHHIRNSYVARVHFLPRYATLARYRLWHCVCPSVCPSVTAYKPICTVCYQNG